jgi:hypothetical protein
MKAFRVVNKSIPFMDNFGKRKYNEIIVTLYQPPYEDENVLNKTGWKQKDVTITDITMEIRDGNG